MRISSRLGPRLTTVPAATCCKVLLIALSMYSLQACADSTDPKPRDNAKQAWTLELDQHAIQMSTVEPYNTIVFTASIRNGVGVPLDGITGVTFSSSDTSMRFMSDDGGLHTRLIVWRPTVTSGTKVAASITIDGVTLTDTALVIVDETQSPLPISEYRLHAVDDGNNLVEARWSLSTGVNNTNPRLRIKVRSGDTGELSNVPVATHSNTLDVVGFGSKVNYPIIGVSSLPESNGQLRSAAMILRRTGSVILRASTTWYGVVHRDSLMSEVVAPTYVTLNIISRTPRGSVTPISVLDVGTITVASGAIVEWKNNTKDSTVTITFDDPDVALAVPLERNNLGPTCTMFGYPIGIEGGNISPLRLAGVREDYPSELDYFFAVTCSGRNTRYFVTRGRYRFRTNTGGEGTIVVQ